jgi:hypothetical protein
MPGERDECPFNARKELRAQPRPCKEQQDRDDSEDEFNDDGRY